MTSGLENSCVYNVAAAIAARMKLLGAEATLESQIRLICNPPAAPTRVECGIEPPPDGPPPPPPPPPPGPWWPEWTEESTPLLLRRYSPDVFEFPGEHPCGSPCSSFMQLLQPGIFERM